MSHKGTIPVTSDGDTIANCLQAVDDCDLFLGIITTQYGKTERGGKSATHLEFERALDIRELKRLISPVPPPFGTAEDGSLQVAEGWDKPYSAAGRFSVLDGESVRIADREDIREMLIASSVAPTRWERQFSDAIEFGDFDHDELRMFSVGLHKEAGCDFESELERVGLMRRGRFTNAAMFFFAVMSLPASRRRVRRPLPSSRRKILPMQVT